MTLPADIEIRPCRPEDFAGVVELLRQLWPGKPLDVAALRLIYDSALNSDRQTYLCARNGGKVAGFGSLAIKANLWNETVVAYVDELVVDAGYRGRGIGTRLLEQIGNVARQRGCRRIELDSAFHRKEAHAFYERLGFESRALLYSKLL